MSLTCPKCTSPFEEGAKFCENCGCNLEQEYAENLVCPECKATYSTNMKYCINDGKKLISPKDLIPECETCHTAYSGEVKFCPRDGGAVKPRYMRANSGAASASSYSNTSGSNSQQDYHLHLDDLANTVYTKASIGNRFLASLLDNFFTGLLALPAIFMGYLSLRRASELGWESAMGGLVVAAFLLIIPLIYALIKDGLGEGQSWGKRTMNLMVVNIDTRTPCSKGESAIRNIVSMLLGGIPYVGWLVEPIVLLVHQEGRKVGDMAAHTQVIETSEF
ncbi:MAG: RDD family protein [Chitinophaga sp.]|uniref:RDD family protein n=1 Tax=Chitinophaga sp. TaxID=1869181 RepID=UPI001B1B45D2|nr:RDD family protein [Chitinophaga sp.]MBO9729654.1 RDD family protein [Chitinophaga sp.]